MMEGREEHDDAFERSFPVELEGVYFIFSIVIFMKKKYIYNNNGYMYIYV